ncbi:MAG: LPS export ABC transporter periplasmic protein LptC [Chromatiaceae bacterium]|jgi:lipopolysaccharide export system protein LptC|nr:LPS export ABC transporter periplasmic protein LptC [Chromatiaceae bacterium]
MAPPGQRLLAVLLLALGTLAWWLYRGEEGPTEAAPERERRPDQIAERFTTTTMDATGVPRRRLQAQQLRHYSGDGASELDQPVLTLFEPPDPPWVVRSDTGRIPPGSDRIDLEGDVRIDRAEGPGVRPVHLRTEALQIERDAEIARTDRPVRVTSGADWLSSERGAQVWFGEALRVELYGRTRARIEPDEDPPTDPAPIEETL